MKNRATIIFLGLISATSGFSNNAHAASSMLCTGTSQTGIFDDASGQCTTTDGQSYRYEIHGVGIGLQESASAFALVCPNVRKSRLDKYEFYGIEATATVLLGAQVAVFTNKHLGTCLMTGLNAGIGASINIDSLSFRVE